MSSESVCGLLVLPITSALCVLACEEVVGLAASWSASHREWVE